jgi:uncharacterized protein
MGPVLNGLTKLQSIESRLRVAKAKLTRCRRNVILQENQIRSLQNAFEAKKEEIQLTRLQSDRFELELKTREEEVAKFRSHLNTSKTNKEYALILTQLNTTKADNSKIETQILELLKDIEADEAECQNIQNQINERKQALEQLRKDSETSAAKFEAEIHQIQTEWDQQAGSIPPEPLDIFKRVADTYDGEAIAAVETQEGRPGAYSCGGCFMGITTESVNLLQTRDDIIRCPTCSRILVLTPKQES